MIQFLIQDLGTVFEKRLIEAYIADHGSDPVTGEELSLDDLVELKSSRIVRPRPPTQTSVPALLATFQNEWDAIALETYELKKQLAQTRQELSTALYDYEGALRLLARVTRERDDARAALAEVQVGAQAPGADGMDVDTAELPEAILATIAETREKCVFLLSHEIFLSDLLRLSSTRRKRPVPKGWITAQDIESFEESKPEWARSKAYKKCATLAEDGGEEAQTIVYGNEDGTAVIHRTDGPVFEVNCGSRITDSLVWDSKPIFSCADGSIRIFEDGAEVRAYNVHAGAATGLALHPCGTLLASVGSDRSYVLYDLSSPKDKSVTRVFADAGKFFIQSHLVPRLTFLQN
jgi:pre-mRNA-processing factor 19